MASNDTAFTVDSTAILEASGTMMIACDLDGTIRAFYPAAERLLGWSAAEVVGRHTPELWHAPDEISRRAAELSLELGRHIAADFEVFAVDGAGHFEEPQKWTYVRKDGTHFPVQLVVSKIRDRSSAVTGVLMTAQDISKHIQAEIERDRVFELSLDLLCVADVNGYFKRVNRAFSRVLGWSEEDLLSRPYLELVHPDDRDSTEKLVTSQMAGNPVFSFDNRYQCKDGSWRILSWTGSPQIDGLMFATARDVTELRRAEMERQQLNADLEGRVAARTKELAKEKRWLRNGNLILESVASDASLSKTAELIVRFVAEEVPVQHCAILSYDAAGDRLSLSSRRNLPSKLQETLNCDRRDDQVDWIWQAVSSRKRVVLDDVAMTDDVRSPADDCEWRSGWAEPIIAGDGEVLGVFVVLREQKDSPSLDELKCVECACGLARTAISRDLARRELKESERQYRILLERMPAPVFVYDRETLAYLAVSDRAIAEYGYSREELLQMTIADIRPKGDVPALLKMLNESGLEFEHRGLWRHQKKNGSLIDVEITTHGLDLAGRSACIVLARDVTETIRVENALQRIENLNKAVLQSAPDSIVVINESGELIEFNRAAEQAFGYTRGQALGRSVKDLLIPSELRDKLESEAINGVATDNDGITGRSIQTTASRSDGKTFPVEVIALPAEVKGQRLLAIYLRDLTATLQNKHELERTTELLQAIVDGTTDAIFAKDLQGRYLLFNRAASELTGRDADDVIGQNDTFLFGQEDGRIAMANDRLVLQSDEPCTIEEQLSANGVTRYYLAMKAPLRDPDGNIIGMIGISRDITERKLVEMSLQESEERYRSMVEHSLDMIYICRDNRITFINQAGVDLLGGNSPEEIIGRDPLDFHHPDDHSQIRRRVEQLLAGSSNVPVSGERIVRLDGRIVEVDVQATSYYSRDQLEIQFVARDVTSRKLVEQEMQRHLRHTKFSAAKGFALSQLSTLHEMLQACADAMVAHLGASSARIWTLNEPEGWLELKGMAGDKRHFDETQARVPLGTHTPGKVALQKVPYIDTSYKDTRDSDSAIDRDRAIFATFPMLIDERCLGVFELYADNNLDQDTRKFLATTAGVIAQGIARKQSEAMLADLNQTLEQRVQERTLKLEQSERFNQATLDSLSAHIAVVDANGNIVATNAAWRKFAQKNDIPRRGVTEGFNYFSVCDVAAKNGDSDAAAVAKALREILAGERSSWEYEYSCHTPEERLWFSCQMTLGYIDGQQHAVIAHENITKIKLVQEELEVAKENAVQSSLAKSEFLAAMSHELRTPLNGILGMNALLMQTDLDQRQRRFAEACVSSGKLLKELINNVLDLSKIEAGKLELDPRECQVEAAVYDVVELFSNLEQENDIDISCQLSPETCVTARIDDNRMRQILVNLIGNAIKFTSAGSVTVVGDRQTDPSGETYLRIEVTDTGIGIPRERKNRLFKAFSQVDSSTTRNFGGTGLGLSICQQLVSLMGGSIGVESQVGIGSTFWFKIPLDVVSEPEARRNERQCLHEAQVVVVDGIGSLAQIAECVTNWGCHYEHVKTFNEAVQLQQRRPRKQSDNLFVLSTLQTIESEAHSSKTLMDRCAGRLIALLTADEEATAERKEIYGVRATLQEPVRPSDLFEVLTSILSSGEVEESIHRERPNSTPSTVLPAKLAGHLLVAEDNKINQLYVVELLRMLGCTCDLVVNGEEVLSLSEREEFDLVLMDCQMPEMDGFAATREIRRREENATPARHIPIVAVTANALKGDRERCLAAGMDDYVSKPIDGEELRKTLSKYLGPV